jgi:CheY-like chemotaxis protein
MPTEPDAERRILIVDDEPIIAHTASRILTKSGFHSLAVGSAEEALELIISWIPHLAIIDVQLPGINGVDLAIRMRSDCPGCKLVLLTGLVDFTALLRGSQRAKYSFDVLMKPVQPEALIQLAANLP